MAIDKTNILIQKSHLQDGKIQISQSLFSIWIAYCIMDILTGHLISHGTLITQPILEEVSKFGKELAKDVTEPCIKSMISLLIKVSSKES